MTIIIFKEFDGGLFDRRMEFLGVAALDYSQLVWKKLKPKLLEKRVKNGNPD